MSASRDFPLWLKPSIAATHNAHPLSDASRRFAAVNPVAVQSVRSYGVQQIDTSGSLGIGRQSLTVLFPPRPLFRFRALAPLIEHSDRDPGFCNVTLFQWSAVRFKRLLERTLRPIQAVVLAQRRALVSSAEQAATLQQGNYMMAERVEHAGQHRRHDVEAVRRGTREPVFDQVKQSVPESQRP